MSLQERVAEEVRALMGRYKVTQMQLAEVLGVPQSGISARVNGKRQFTLEDIERLAAFFGVDPAELLGGQAGPRPGGGPGGGLRMLGARHGGFGTDTDQYPYQKVA